MIIHKILDEVFSTWSNIAVLRVLNNVNLGLSGREIAKQAGMSAPSCLEALSYLENYKIVARQRGGRDHLFTLNREHYLVEKIVIPNLNSENKFAESLYKDITKYFEKYCLSIFLFGSVARREERVDSDLDICVVCNNLNSKKSIDVKYLDFSFLLHKKYGVSLSPFYISKSDFIKRAKLNKPPIADVIKEGKLLYGKSIKELLNDKTDSKKNRR